MLARICSGVASNEVWISMVEGRDAQDQVERLRDERPQRHERPLWLLTAPEGEDLKHQSARPFDPLEYACERIVQLGIAGDIHLEQLGVAQDRGQDIVEIVGDPACEGADRLHLLGLSQARLQLRPQLLLVLTLKRDARQRTGGLHQCPVILRGTAMAPIIDGKGPRIWLDRESIGVDQHALIPCFAARARLSAQIGSSRNCPR